ncbi:amidase [Penicillium odoratum]|uniref:amidase n=1 Tax=Penicillium odoratum TaxID=1167516 RepID=UPI00254846D9|nr:amidase [Penicillium odoratum]KAJ5776812.1 amidase [Penicillium odoratum]
MATTWEDIVASKRASITAAIPAEWVLPTLLPSAEQLDVSNFIAESGWFSDSQIEILKSTASELLPRLAQGSLSSKGVTKAFCKSAAAAHQLINPLTEVLFGEALVMAKALDEHLKATGKPKGPLHGLPISIKDNFNIKEKDSTQGFTSRANQSAESHSPNIQLLVDAGEVLYVKTNVPPGMKRPETYNAVFAGGSSGGEGALISFGGSCLVVGTDMGGPCRVPAACGGIYTLRPSTTRWSISATSTVTPGQDSIRAVPGPMAKTLEDSQTGGDLKGWDRDPSATRARALEGAVATLKAAGHDIVEFPMTTEEMKEAVDFSFGLFLADAGNWVKTALGNTGQPVPPDLTFLWRAPPKPSLNFTSFMCCGIT